MKFVPRLTAPEHGDKHYYSNDNIFYACGFGMPNCTAYAWGRLYELSGKRYIGLTGNAEDFIESAARIGLKTGNTPKLGAIICWRAGQVKNSADGAGHVGIVEQIKENGDIVVSQSAWKSTEFYLTTLTKASGYIYDASRAFQGFIYCGIDYEDASQDTPSNSIRVGMQVELLNVHCFSSETAMSTYGVRSGIYYLWDATVKNGRIRVTNALSKVGIRGQVSFWVSLDEIGLVDTESKNPMAGAKYVITNMPVYGTEKGPSIGKRSGVYYVWDNTVRNGRVRMTNSPARVGVLGQVSFWVEVNKLI